MAGVGVDDPGVDYVYVQSRGAHGHFAVGAFEAFVGSQREIWIGSDGSGMIKDVGGPASFFTEAGRTRWQAAGSPRLSHGPSVALFAPGCLGRARERLAELPSEPEALERVLTTHQSLTVHHARQLLGEALPSPEFCRALYVVVERLDGVEVLDEVSDQLGRVGHGLARVEHGQRVEMVFDEQTSELLGYQEFLVDPARGYAPVGTLVGWTAYTARRLVDSLPPGTPPLPDLPCSPPGAGRATQIGPGFFLSTGYFTELLPNLDRWRAAGVITEAQYESAKSKHATD